MHKILIVGKGNVGQATARSLPLADIAFHDPYKDEIVPNPGEHNHAIVCVDTLQKGPEDYTDLDSVIEYLQGYSGVIAIRSTIGPNKAIELSNIFGDSLIIFPEFMDHHDFKSQNDSTSRIVLGGEETITKQFFETLETFGYPQKRSVFFVSPSEASIIKLSSNAMLATKIIAFNAVYDICDSYSANYDLIRNAIGTDDRIGLGHTLVPSPDDGLKGFGGHCLPKDIKAIAEIDSLGLFNFIDILNKKLGR